MTHSAKVRWPATVLAILALIFIGAACQWTGGGTASEEGTSTADAPLESQSGAKRFDRIVVVNYCGAPADDVHIELFEPGPMPWSWMPVIHLGTVDPNSIKGRTFLPFDMEMDGVVRAICHATVNSGMMEVTVDAEPGTYLNTLTIWILPREKHPTEPPQPDFLMTGDGIQDGTATTIHND